MSTPPVVAPPPGNTRFPLIDALRAIAALSIFGLHAGVAFSHGSSAWYSPYLARLDIGVTIFFLISGFLLYRPFVAARVLGTPRPRVADYARSRALRILPAYWLALTVLAIYPGLGGMWTGHWWVYYGLVQQYVPDWSLGGLSQAWSLSVEMSFYIVLPLIALAMRLPLAGRDRVTQIRAEFVMVAGLYLLSVLYRLAVTGGHTPELIGLEARYTLVPGVAVTHLPGTIDWFALGMGLAVASVSLQASGARPLALRLVERAPSLFWGAALALFVGGVAFGVFPDFPRPFGPAQWFAGQAVYGLIALLLLVPAVFGDRLGGLPRAVMRNPLLAWLGLISYGIFLWHVAIVDKLGKREAGPFKDLPSLVLVAVALAITVACAAASYYGLERPLLRLKHRGRTGTPVSEPPAGVPAGLGTAAPSE